MKTYLKHPFLRPALIAGLGFLLAGRVVADEVLYSFLDAGTNSPNQGGAWPTAGVLLSKDLLYGVTAGGGANGGGTVFSLRTNNAAFADVFDFPASSRPRNAIYPSCPKYGFLLSGDTFYGTMYYGGSWSNGMVFAVHTNGTGFTPLHEFTARAGDPIIANSDGCFPRGSLVLSSNILYGTAEEGGSSNHGTVFAVHTNGTGFVVLHDFVGGEGFSPVGGVILSASGRTLYGTTQFGGANTNGGTVFAVNTDGNGFATLHSFPAISGVTNDEGWGPIAGLVLSPTGDTLYGTTAYGGATGYGTVFAIGTAGSGFRIVRSFPVEGAPPAWGGANIGVQSVWPLVFSDNGKVLYGSGVLVPDFGPTGGSLFALTTDGASFATLYTCGSYYVDNHNADGSIPNRVMRLGKALYGTMLIGGVGDGGIVFRIDLGLGATVSATPPRPKLGDTFKVVVTALNRDEENITTVRLAGPIDVSKAGVVSAAGFSGPTMTPVLAPLAKTRFTYQFKATNYGTVNFTAAVTGLGLGGTVTSSPWTSDDVTIAPLGDLLVKSADPDDTTFAGEGIFQKDPFNDQDVSQPVGTNGAAVYIVRLKNQEPVPRAYVLRGNTNNIANWNLQALAGSSNIFPALISAAGWTTPQIAATGHMDLQVSLAPTPKAGMQDKKWIQIRAYADATNTDVLDSLWLHTSLVPVPVKVTIHRVLPGGYTAQSIDAGQYSFSPPLVPLTDPEALATNLSAIHGGLVADGVTPLVIKLEGDPVALLQFTNGLDFLFHASMPPSDNYLTGALINDRLALLHDGAWQSATDVVLTATSHIAYVELTPIASDDLTMVSQPPGVPVDFIVDDTTSLNQAGDVKFALQKPPIALIHGYATAGDWGADFKAILGRSRPLGLETSPNNFIVTVKYGQDIGSGLLDPALAATVSTGLGNTTGTLVECARWADEKFAARLEPLHANWAFTHFDVVAHSQGGVVSRMLSTYAGNIDIPQPFRNPANLNRGRFHRVVTIGSPHNGSRLLHYLLALQQRPDLLKFTGLLAQFTAEAAVGSKFAQAKFDPAGAQIRELNGTDRWRPDPGAQFHLVRTTIDNGASPGPLDLTPAYKALGLDTYGGGVSVIPHGSDGVVDLDSMSATEPGLGVVNVYTLPAAQVVSHAPPFFLFAADSSQTASTEVAEHVIAALDQDSRLPGGEIKFGPFPWPVPLLASNQVALIDDYALLPEFVDIVASVSSLPRPRDADPAYRYQVDFPYNLPPASEVSWIVQVYGPSGITTDGVELSPEGDNSRQVTVTVDSALVGDVVLSGLYLSSSNTVVSIAPTVIASSAPAGATLTGFQLLPASIALPVGADVSPQVVANYSDGSSALRYVTSSSVAVASSQPAVVSVADPLNWQLSAVGTAQISVTWSGFTAATQITVFDPATDTPPTISVQGIREGQLTLAWVGYSTAYVLEGSADLGQANSWQPVPVVPERAGGRNFVTLPMTGAQHFYRLRWDPSVTSF